MSEIQNQNDKQAQIQAEEARRAAEAARRAEQIAKQAEEARKAAEAAKLNEAAKQKEADRQKQEAEAAKAQESRAEQTLNTLERENEAGKLMFAQGQEPEVINQQELEARQQAVDEGRKDLLAAEAKTAKEEKEASEAQEDLEKAKVTADQAEAKAKKAAEDAKTAKDQAAEAAQKAGLQTVPTDISKRLELNSDIKKVIAKLDYEKEIYETRVLARKNIGQQGMDNVREAIWGTRDDQQQNFVDTRSKIDDLQGRLLSKQISVDEAKKELEALTEAFNTKTQSVADEQAKHNALANSAKEVSRLVVGGGTAVAVTVASGGNVFLGAAAGTAAFEVFDAIDNAEARLRDVDPSHTSMVMLGVDAVADPKSITPERAIETSMETGGKALTSLFFAATGADAMKLANAAVAPTAGATAAKLSPQLTLELAKSGVPQAVTKPGIIQSVVTGTIETTAKGGKAWLEASKAAPAKVVESFNAYAVPFLKAAPAQVAKFFGTQLLIGGAPTVLHAAGEFAMDHQRLKPMDGNDLAALRRDPDAYMTANYDAKHLGGMIQNKDFGTVNGHLMLFTRPDGKTEFYRRVPKDLFDAALTELRKTDPKAERAYFSETVDLGDGPEKITVEIRPPFKHEPLRDAYARADFAEGSSGLSQSVRFSAAIGPQDGLQMSAAGEATLMYRYQSPTATTLRVGLKSPTQGDGVGIRQQDTRINSRISVGVTPMDFNRLNLVDLDDKGTWHNGTRISAGSARAYLDIGDRNRIRFDSSFAARGSDLQTNLQTLRDKQYIRARETGFAELGFGSDFLRYQNNPVPGLTVTQGPMGLPTASAFGGKSPVSINFNGYYELQLYGPDLRAQVGAGSNGLLTSGKGLKPFPPSFEIDPALQITTTGLVPTVTGTGGPFHEDTKWKPRPP